MTKSTLLLSMVFCLVPTVSLAQDLQRVPLSQIEADCSCDLDAETAGDDVEAINFALSTAWIDAWDLTEIRKDGVLFLTGEVETENGTRDIVATMIGQSDQRELRYVLDEPGQLDQGVAMTALISNQPAKAAPVTAGPKTVAPRPKANPPKMAPKNASVDYPTGINNPFKGLNYPAPEIVKSGQYSQKIGNWPENKGVQMATPGDTLSPRLTVKKYKPGRRASDEALINQALKDAGLKRAKYPVAEVLDVSKEMVGTHSVIAYGAARRNGKIVRFFANVDLDKAGSATSKVLEAPQDEWNSWGGAAVVMAMTGIHKPRAFTPEALAHIRQMSPQQETDITEEHFTAIMISLFKGMMAANMGTLNMMQSFNMATATCAGDSNCTVSMDGVGGYQAETR